MKVNRHCVMHSPALDGGAKWVGLLGKLTLSSEPACRPDSFIF